MWMLVPDFEVITILPLHVDCCKYCQQVTALSIHVSVEHGGCQVISEGRICRTIFVPVLKIVVFYDLSIL